MTVGDAIQLADAVKPNAFPDAVKIRWLSRLDGETAAEVMLMAPAELATYDYTALSTTEAKAVTLLVDAPYDDIYPAWLEAMIDAANGEYNKYQNSLQLFNERYNEFVAWFAGMYRPANSYHFPQLREGGESHV